MDAPEVVTGQLGGGGDFEGGHAHTLRVDALEDAADDAVLAAGVHALQHDQQFVLALGKEQLLQRFELGIELGDLLEGRLFIAFPGGCFGGVPSERWMDWSGLTR